MGANAYVSGLGPTKEIVLYDNLIRDYSTDEILSVVAHEAGHYKMNHIWVGLFVMPVSNPFALFALFSFLGFIIDKKRKTDTDTTFHIPYILFLLIAFSWFINPFINVLSRRMERDADNYSLKLTNNTSAFISAEVKLYSKHAYYNYDPNIFYKFLYYSHPPVKERIEFAKGYEKHIR
jgi:STE24 endopeptidase